MAVNFTAQRIKDHKCPDGKDQSFLWDDKVSGLGLRATKGSKAYIFQYKFEGSTRRITIGKPEAWSIPLVRDEARRLQRQLDQGHDPREVKKEVRNDQKVKQQARLTRAMQAREAWNAYLSAPHPKWGDTHRRDHELAAQEGGEQPKIGKALTKPGPLASLLRRPLSEITADVVAEWLVKESKDRPTFARNSYRKLRTFINWCSENPAYKEIVHANCCLTSTVRNLIPAGKAKPNDCLQREQLQPWFSKVQKISNPAISAYLQCLLLTGARKEELLSLRWNDIDFKWRKMSIGDKVDESGLRLIPLTPYVARLLNSLPKTNQWVFSSTKGTQGHIIGVTKPHNRALKEAGIPHVSIHGLRRSFTTLCEWIEIPRGVVAQIQGHKPSAIAEKHYTRRNIDFLIEKHEKIESWILKEAGIANEAA